VKVLNYDFAARLGAIGRRTGASSGYRIHKRPAPGGSPKISLVLLDWSCRESFHALRWLNEQNVPRHEYELIWIELYDRVLPQALEQADVVVTLDQKGIYHKHLGYNVGLLLARGEIVTICDSDAVFPRDFMESVLGSFRDTATGRSRSLVLMHHELRTSLTYPARLDSADELKDRQRWQWWDITPNAGACMSVLHSDAVRFGGFDECPSYRGYLCGPYDLGWRMVNAGIPEIWHDEATVLWHFAHPDPVGNNGFTPSFRRLLENTYPHVDLHALTAVDHFSSGRILPNRENPEIHALRMSRRQIGTAFERKYSNLTGPRGFRPWQKGFMRAALLTDLAISAVRSPLKTLMRAGKNRLRLALAKAFGEPFVLRAKQWRVWARARRQALGLGFNRRIDRSGRSPQLAREGFKGHNIIYFDGKFFGLPQAHGAFEPSRAASESDCPYFRGRSINEIKDQIRDAVNGAPSERRSWRPAALVHFARRVARAVRQKQ